MDTYRHSNRKATILKAISYDKIKLQWKDEGEIYITEIKMLQNEIAENYHLLITDEVDEDEIDSITHFWSSKIQQLHHITGV